MEYKIVVKRNRCVMVCGNSGDPVDIICGTENWIGSSENFDDASRGTFATSEEKGVIELLWDIFGGTVNEQGYKVLDPRIGAIYGDSITLERAEEICQRLKAKGFASTNVVLGIGSYTYNCNTRDTIGIAIKRLETEEKKLKKSLRDVQKKLNHLYKEDIK